MFGGNLGPWSRRECEGKILALMEVDRSVS